MLADESVVTSSPPFPLPPPINLLAFLVPTLFRADIERNYSLFPPNLSLSLSRSRWHQSATFVADHHRFKDVIFPNAGVNKRTRTQCMTFSGRRPQFSLDAARRRRYPEVKWRDKFHCFLVCKGPNLNSSSKGCQPSLLYRECCSGFPSISANSESHATHLREKHKRLPGENPTWLSALRPSVIRFVIHKRQAISSPSLSLWGYLSLFFNSGPSAV